MSNPSSISGRPRRYKGCAPFGIPTLKHREAARMLGVRPKDLLKLDVKRGFHLGRYVYDPIEITALAATLNTPKELSVSCPIPG